MKPLSLEAFMERKRQEKGLTIPAGHDIFRAEQVLYLSDL